MGARRKFINSKYQYKGFLHRELLETNENDLLNSLCTAVYKNDLKLVHKYVAHPNSKIILNSLCKNISKIVPAKDKNGNEGKYSCTAMHLASKYGHHEIAEFLYLNGSDINKLDSEECTSLDIAMLANNVEMIEWCLSKTN